MKQILRKLSNIGTEKITFTGGEPLLHPHLGDSLFESKRLGLTTMIVSNGSLIKQEFLEKNHTFIDWIGLSLDSSNERTEFSLGRGFGNHVEIIEQKVELIKKFGIKLKINTVVTSSNWFEDMGEIIVKLKPDRWKVFQILKIKGENDIEAERLFITAKQFMSFVRNHIGLNPIYEPNELFQGSYLMLDPLGRFFQNSKGHITYSQSILDVKPMEALTEVGWDRLKFLKRGGIYDWK